MKKTMVIMAAGMGSRFGGLKQITAMGPSDEILMEYSVYDGIRAGFDKVVFIITEAMKDEFDKKIGSRVSSKIEVEYAVQDLNDIPAGFKVPQGRVKPWGTSQAILAAKNSIKTPFAVLNADDFYGQEAFSVMAGYMDSLKEGVFESAMVGYKIEKTLSKYGSVTRGICQTGNGLLQQISEIKDIEYGPNGTIVYRDGQKSGTLNGDELCSMNFWGFTPHLFDYLEKDFARFLKEKGSELKSEWLIPITVDDMIQSNVTKVTVLQSGDSWFGVTYPEDKPRVIKRIAELVEQGVYPSPLFGGSK